jgi:hypothetical protein
MNPNGGDPNGTSGAEEEFEQSIAELMEQESDTHADFLAKVRNKIHRRTAASQLASYTWHMPKVVLIEMVSVLSYVFTAISGKKR